MKIFCYIASVFISIYFLFVLLATNVTEYSILCLALLFSCIARLDEIIEKIEKNKKDIL